MIKDLYRKMKMRSFIRCSIMICLGADVSLAFYIYKKFTGPEKMEEIIALSKSMMPSMQGVELSEEMRVMLMNQLETSLKIALLAYLCLHCINYVLFFFQKKWAIRYTNILAHLGVPFFFLLSMANVTTIPVYALVFGAYSLGLLWVALGLRQDTVPALA